MWFETVRRQLQIIGDAVCKMADRMGNRSAKARVEFTSCREPSGCVGCIKHEHTLPGLREVCGTDQSVMACPDNDRIISVQL